MRRVTRKRGFCSGNLVGNRPDGHYCPKGCHCYAHATWFRPGTLLDLALACGWHSAYLTPISPELEHSAFMVDMILEI